MVNDVSRAYFYAKAIRKVYAEIAEEDREPGDENMVEIFQITARISPAHLRVGVRGAAQPGQPAHPPDSNLPMRAVPASTPQGDSTTRGNPKNCPSNIPEILKYSKWLRSKGSWLINTNTERWNQNKDKSKRHCQNKWNSKDSKFQKYDSRWHEILEH